MATKKRAPSAHDALLKEIEQHVRANTKLREELDRLKGMYTHCEECRSSAEDECGKLRVEIREAEGRGMTFVLRALVTEKPTMDVLRGTRTWIKLVSHPAVRDVLQKPIRDKKDALFNEDHTGLFDEVQKYMDLPVQVAEINKGAVREADLWTRVKPLLTPEQLLKLVESLA